MHHFNVCAICVSAVLGACVSSEMDSAPAAFAYFDACGEAPSAPPPAPERCLFGEVFSDIRTDPALLITSETWIRSVEGLSGLDAEQLLIAVQQSSHTDVTTAGEALDRVDQAEVRKIIFYELASERWFAVYEYGAGDNSYGAFFDLDGTDVRAAIHDGDILDCAVLPLPAATTAPEA